MIDVDDYLAAKKSLLHILKSLDYSMLQKLFEARR
jgi:hypothetical protein